MIGYEITDQSDVPNRMLLVEGFPDASAILMNLLTISFVTCLLAL